VLEVATGPGYVAEAFAATLLGGDRLDMTQAPLEIAERRRRERGLTNLHFQLGNGRQLPFADGSFDLVVCRYSFHISRIPTTYGWRWYGFVGGMACSLSRIWSPVNTLIAPLITTVLSGCATLTRESLPFSDLLACSRGRGWKSDDFEQQSPSGYRRMDPARACIRGGQGRSAAP